MTTSSTESSPLALACGSDDNYAMPLAVTLYSALSSLPSGRPAHVFVIDGGITEPSRRRLQRVIESIGPQVHLEFAAADTPRLRDLKTQQWINSATYLRLLVPEVVPDSWDRAIYLDSDLLVQADLGELWAQEMGGRALLAVKDEVIPTVSAPEGLPNFADLGLAPETPYFNGGMLVLNLDRWRREGVSTRVLQYTRDHADINRYADQDGLNAILAHDWSPLPARWNLAANVLWAASWASEEIRQTGRALRPLLDGPHICHFAGQAKPWRPSCLYPIKPRWLRCLRRSRWFTPAESLRWFANYYARHHGYHLHRRLLRKSE